MTGPISNDFSLFRWLGLGGSTPAAPPATAPDPFGGQDAIPAGDDYAAYAPGSSSIIASEGLGKFDLPPGPAEGPLLPPALGLDDAVGAALAGQDIRMVNGRGEEFDLGIRRSGTEGAHDVFQVSVGDRSLRVNLPAGQDPTAAMSRILDFYTQHPAGATQHLRSVTVSEGANPQDAEFARRYGMAGFVSAATANNRDMWFWNGATNLNQGIFDHEMGHIYASNIPGQSMVPRGWEPAAAGDAGAVSDYARTNMAEDFAESWKHYLEARRQGPEAQAAFEGQYPSRSNALAQLYDQGTARGIRTAGSPPATTPAPDFGSTALGRLLNSIFG